MLSTKFPGTKINATVEFITFGRLWCNSIHFIYALSNFKFLILSKVLIPFIFCAKKKERKRKKEKRREEKKRKEKKKTPVQS